MFNENGTISLTIGTETYKIDTITLDQLYDFHALRNELAEKARDRITEASKKLAEAGEESKEGKKLIAELGDRRFAFRMVSEPWLRQVFETVGSKPLPEDLGVGPAYLADPGLPNQMLEFWRNVPLALSRTQNI